MMMTNHPFHLVTLSPWPMITSFNIMNTLMSIIILFYNHYSYTLIMNSILLIMSMLQWWRDVIRESTMQGFHTITVSKLMKYSMILFIISELFFFISFFWAYFHSSISPNVEIGSTWPPSNIMMFNPFDIPLLNTIILISSGMTITWSHHLLLNNHTKSLNLMLITIILGVCFSSLQYLEYKEALFTINDSIFGSIFFMMTGFHGLHVIIGILFMLTCYLRMLKLQLSKTHHFNFEAASWYWHFVDIVWLFLYVFLYWWSS